PEISTHAALGRRHDARIPSHDVIAGEEQLRPFEREAEMIRCVPRRVECLKREILTFETIAILQHDIRLEIVLDVLATCWARSCLAGAHNRAAETSGQGACPLLQGREAIHM